MYNTKCKRDYSNMNYKNSNQNNAKKKKSLENSEDSLCTLFTKTSIKNLDAIIYCRVSTKNQTFGTSLESQKIFCQEYCSNNNLNIKSIINETNSAKLMDKQQELKKMLYLYKNINLIIYEPSRLSRNLRDFVQFIEQCKELNITIHFVQDKLVSSNNADFKKILSGIVDGETESKNIGMRIKRSINFRKRNGTFKASIPKYGFKHIKNNFKIHSSVNIEENRIINLIQKLYWGADIDLINNLLVQITGTVQELYFLTNPEETVQKIEWGNLRMIDIANFLNSIPIYRRNKKWTSNAISQIIRQC